LQVVKEEEVLFNLVEAFKKADAEQALMIAHSIVQPQERCAHSASSSA